MINKGDENKDELEPTESAGLESQEKEDPSSERPILIASMHKGFDERIMNYVFGFTYNPSNPQEGAQEAKEKNINLGSDFWQVAPPEAKEGASKMFEESEYNSPSYKDQEEQIKRFFVLQYVAETLYFSAATDYEVVLRTSADLAIKVYDPKTKDPKLESPYREEDYTREDGKLHLEDLDPKRVKELQNLLATRMGRMKLRIPLGATRNDLKRILEREGTVRDHQGIALAVASYRDLFDFVRHETYGENLKEKDRSLEYLEAHNNARESWKNRFFWLYSVGQMSEKDIADLLLFDIENLKFGSFLEQVGVPTTKRFFKGLIPEIAVGIHYLKDGFEIVPSTDLADRAGADLILKKGNQVVVIQVKGHSEYKFVNTYNVTNATSEPRLLRGFDERQERIFRQEARSRFGENVLLIWAHAPSDINNYIEGLKQQSKKENGN